ncbi:MAG: Formate hydrogenlyase transcriptional activator, partial [Myxococcaceae bacterium]|nr:Formate hydrogenlyase transcriptional activator [Myxococcaceae bacterium]
MRTTRPASALLRQADEALAEARWVAALDLSARAVDAADRLPEGTDRSHARRLHAEALYWADRDDDAARMADEAMRVAHAARSPGEEALAAVMLVIVLSARCDFVEALRQSKRATELADRAEHPSTLRTALAEHALVLSRVGDGQGSREAFAQAFAIPVGDQPARWELRGLLNVASADAAAGRYAAALDALARGEALAAAGGVEASWTIA